MGLQGKSKVRKVADRKFPESFELSCSEFCPNYWRSLCASFHGKWRTGKIHQKSQPFFNAKFPGELEDKVRKSFLESGQSNDLFFFCPCWGSPEVFGIFPMLLGFYPITRNIPKCLEEIIHKVFWRAGKVRKSDGNVGNDFSVLLGGGSDFPRPRGICLGFPGLPHKFLNCSDCGFVLGACTTKTDFLTRTMLTRRRSTPQLYPGHQLSYCCS